MPYLVAHFGGPFSQAQAIALLAAQALCTLLWALWTWGWATTGRSLGDHIMGLRVVSHSGHALGWATAAVRAAFCLAFPFGLLWVLVSGANRSAQDVVLRTSVIHEWVLAMPSVPEGELSPEAQPSAELPTEEP